MASSLPFNDMLEAVDIPDFDELKYSLRQHGVTVPFTVYNYRDGSEHRIEVQVVSISKLRHQAENGRPTWRIGYFSVDGDIIRIDNRAWWPPANQFYARYVEGIPEANGLKIISHV